MNAEQMKTLAVATLEDLKARQVVSLAVNHLTDVTDYLVIASGTSSRHVKSLAYKVVEAAKEQGVRPLGVEGETSAEWILVDFGDIVVHVMMPETRAFYDLERLWSVPAAGDGQDDEPG